MEERKEEISTKKLLEETLRAYAWITNAVIVPGEKQGRVMVKDIELANAMIDRMATLSNLIEKEQSRISS
ncbi:MAG: hypothetical protein SOY71_05010 [Dialister sp.]|nr:hypothetical protein [Dialister sp.]MDY4074463.1 hypothetical protein [Dialister sp.]MDY5061812.1 hypothetical protein [Dialister sp.]MDY5545535.1 hypothetical protein [Dialister sp.]